MLWAAALALVPTACTKPEAPKVDAKAAAVPVVVAKAMDKSMPLKIKAIGNVQASSVVIIRSQVTGQLAKVHFQEGQEVKKGDILFTIDQRPFEGMLMAAKANLQRDEAQLESARLEYEREKKLLDGALISVDEFEKADAAYKAMKGTVLADQASVSNATLNLEFTTIRSPIDGRTGNLIAHEGNIVKSPDDSLLTINQVKPIYVVFSVPEQHLPAIRQRMRESALSVEASYVNMDASPPQGELTFIDNAVDTTTGTIQLKATFANTDNLLWPGQFVNTAMTLSEEAHSIVVPSQAVQPGQEGEIVYVVKPDQTVEVRKVESGIIEHGEMVMKSGIKAGETVVIDGHLRLVPGSRIIAKPPVEEKPIVIGTASQ